MLISEHPKDGGLLVLDIDPSVKWRVEVIPAKTWDRKAKRYELPILPNVPVLRENFVASEFTDGAIQRIRRAIASVPAPKGFPGDYPGPPMAHQKKALDLAWGKREFFFAHAMGAGKTYTILTLSAQLFREGHIRGLLVVCPASIRADVWLPEVEKWLSPLGIRFKAHAVEPSNGAKTDRFISAEDDSFRILIVSVQGLSRADSRAYRAAGAFLSSRPCAMAVDEASKIKTPTSKRTKNIITLGALAAFRYCATGTKITNGIHDLYAQFRFLNWRIFGHKTFYGWRAKYCKMGGFEGKEIIGYEHVPELMQLAKPYIHVVRKSDANQLPPKTYQIRTVKASAEQRRIYKELKDYMETSMGDDDLEATTVLARMMRYQQMAGGNFPYQEVLEGKNEQKTVWASRPLATNPKLSELLSIAEETDEKMIVWARFVPEIEAICGALEHAHGKGSTVSYYGQVSKPDRAKAIRQFYDNEKCRFFVANQQTAGMGLTLTCATLVVYYSNSFSFEDRVQSEDRCHRTGQKNAVTYIDLLSDLQIDKDIREALEKKQSMASFVADRLRTNA